MKVVIAIDPGKKGGIAIPYKESVLTYNMPIGYPDIYNLLSGIQKAHSPDEIVAVVEDVGHGIPGQSSKATATFANHMGHIEMALYALGIPMHKVTPQKWEKYYSNTVGNSKGLTKTQWKNKLKTLAMTIYPSLKVTLNTADALLLLNYALHNGL